MGSWKVMPVERWRRDGQQGVDGSEAARLEKSILRKLKNEVVGVRCRYQVSRGLRVTWVHFAEVEWQRGTIGMRVRNQPSTVAYLPLLQRTTRPAPL